ncbi:phosphotransferase [Streptomyces evansiae]|uniref:phosphotransferase n=1 Tax=Streptomyces evansiae TaxID=3075535 RepID=UPI0028852F26|nr:phosphotransferase [Streptomyces sp. DSM 41859]MDT0424220.1 phosphotransferase [Streptomyces sp. DSM 41859]
MTGDKSPGGAADGPTGGSRGELIGSGRSADVYALGAEWVVRRYRSARDTAAEAAVMRRVASYGYPLPALRPGPFAANEMVVRRIEGPTLARALTTGDASAAEGAALLAALLRRLHRVPPPEGAPGGHRLLHLDLHPENVLLSPSGPVVIDWESAAVGPPGLDWASSALILAEASLRLDLAALVELFLPEFLVLAPPELGTYLTAARERRERIPGLTAEERALPGAAFALLPPLWADARARYDAERHP